MIARIGEPKQDTYNSGTYDGVYINAMILAKTANTTVANAHFRPEQVQVKAVLRRGGRTIDLFNTNLLVLGTFCALRNGLHEFYNGIDRVYPSAGVYAKKQRSVFLPFGGPHRINDGDRLIIEITPSASAFDTDNVDVANSYVEFYARPCIGYELGVYTTNVEVVQANTSQQSFSPGNNVTRIGFLQLDKDNYSEEVLTSLTLSSDRLDMQMTFQQLLAHNAASWPDHHAYRYGATPPTQSVFRFADILPQSFILFEGEMESNELDECRISCVFNSASVNVSKNWFLWRTYESSKQQISDAVKRQNKHLSEKMQKLPAVQQ